MFKKLLSFLTVFALLLTVVPSTAFAEVVPGAISISVANIDSSFNPSAGEVLSINVDYGDDIVLSNGSIKIKKANLLVAESSWGNVADPLVAPVVAPVGPFRWDGKSGCSDEEGVVVACLDGEYTAEVFISYANAEGGVDTGSDTEAFSITGGLAITALTAVAPGGTFDPAPDGDDEDLTIAYTLNKAPNSVTVEIKNSRNVLMRSFQGVVPVPANGGFTWDGVSAGEIVEPGVYNVIFTATKDGEAPVTQTIPVTVLYGNDKKAEITDFSATPATFNPEVGSTIIRFTNDQKADISLEIQNAAGGVLKTFGEFRDDEILANTDNEISWNGENDNDARLGNGTYKAVVIARNNFGVTVAKTDIVVDNGAPLPGGFAITALTAVPTDGGTFDPAQDGEDEDLIIAYTLNKAPTAVNVKVKNSRNVEMKNFDGQLQNSQFSWDGVFANEIVEPGVYSVIFTATKAGEAAVTRTIEVTVRYDSQDKAQITGLKADPESFDPDNGDTTITFRNDERADITLEIQNADGVALKTFDDFKDDDIVANTDNKISWNGDRTNGDQLGNGTYKAVVVARNDFGVTVATIDVKIDDSGAALPKSNAHISNISCKPATTFEPAEDEELECGADVDTDNIDVVVFAVRSGVEIELFDDQGVDKGNDAIEFTWDGRDDDDEYVDEGSWRIEFRSTDSNNRELLSGLTRKIEYAKPKIDEFLLSKDKIDNDLGEITYAIFRLDDDAQINLNYLLDGDEDDQIEEEMDVEADQWYAIEVNADGYGYEDDIDIELIAGNDANIDVNDKRRDSLDLAEEKESSNKANITNDMIYPVVTDCNEDLEVSYTLEDPGSVEISIHKGKTSGGSKVAELINLDNQDDGEHSVTWNCRDDNGNALSDGFYTYKIVSRDSSTDTESGIFVVGDVGDGGSSNSDDDDDDNNGGSHSGVIIDGGDNDNDDEEEPNEQEDPVQEPVDESCAGFTDIDENYEYCEAVAWAYQEGIFQGYEDGTFRPDMPINRVELLKVVLNALGVDASENPAGNLGFNDVIPGSWYMPYINKGRALGIFVGDAGKGTARPGEFINRAETLKIVFETLRASRGRQVGNSPANYGDVKVTDWFYRYVGESKKYDLFDNIQGNNFMPSAATTRGEVVELLFRLDGANLI